MSLLYELVRVDFIGHPPKIITWKTIDFKSFIWQAHIGLLSVKPSLIHNNTSMSKHAWTPRAVPGTSWCSVNICWMNQHLTLCANSVTDGLWIFLCLCVLTCKIKWSWKKTYLMRFSWGLKYIEALNTQNILSTQWALASILFGGLGRKTSVPTQMKVMC